ncbi:PCRF domain-containing protein, partial [candidate division WWE3 bacterium]|nr:PCRF domain-containing protein [candidate division WWE3 bacterium]
MQELVEKYSDLSNRVDHLSLKLDLENKRNTIRQLEAETMKPDFWNDNEHARTVSQELAELVKEAETIDDIKNKISENVSFIELTKREHEDVSDPEFSEITDSLAQDLDALTKEIDSLEVQLFLGGKYDKKPAILSIHAGQGGTEAMDWVAMLARMYERYASSQGWKIEKIDEV